MVHPYISIAFLPRVSRVRSSAPVFLIAFDIFSTEHQQCYTMIHIQACFQSLTTTKNQFDRKWLLLLLLLIFGCAGKRNAAVIHMHQPYVSQSTHRLAHIHHRAASCQPVAARRTAAQRSAPLLHCSTPTHPQTLSPPPHLSAPYHPSPPPSPPSFPNLLFPPLHRAFLMRSRELIPPAPASLSLAATAAAVVLSPSP